MTPWYLIENPEGVDTPALILYPDRIEKNLEILKTFIDDLQRLRPHIKTHKCADVAKLMMEAGISKFKCATIAEAEMLASMGARDILLAYQPQGPKGTRFCTLLGKFPDTLFSCLIDNPETLQELSLRAGEHQQSIRVFIDLNVGMNRTGIVPGKEAFDLYQAARKTKNIQFIGLHAYDGHIRAANLKARTEECNAAYQGVDELRRKIADDMGKEPVIVAGGTPTFPIHAKRKGVEASPGTFIFWDRGYAQILSEQPFEFAALVLTRVISKPADNTLCVDLGHKSIASENPIAQRVYFLNAPELEPRGHSEEHMILRDPGNRFKVGDLLYGVPYHVCPTVALYDEASICRDNTVNGTWLILARKRKITV